MMLLLLNVRTKLFLSSLTQRRADRIAQFGKECNKMFPAWSEQNRTKPEIQGQNARCSLLWNAWGRVTLQQPEK
jgi:hypothetical protein